MRDKKDFKKIVSMENIEQTLTDAGNFIFNTFEGVGILLVSTILICIIACAIIEHRYKKAMLEKQKALQAQEEAEWNLDDDE